MNPLVEATLRANCATMTCVEIEDVEALKTLLREHGYHVHVADLNGAHGETAKFLRIANALHGDVYEEFHPSINLAAMDDFLIDDLAREGKIALLILSAEELVERHANLLFNMTLIFALQCQRLKSRDIPALLTTFLVGNGPNFAQGLSNEPVKRRPPRPRIRTQEQVDRLRAKREAEHLAHQKALKEQQ